MGNIDRSDPNVVRESQKNPVRNVAVVGLFDSERRILLVRTKRFPDHWQPIGGGMKHTDSSPVETLVRELREETGITFNPDKLQLHLTTNYDFGDGKVFFYVASFPQDIEPQFDSGELAEWRWFPVASLESLKTFPATQKFFESLKLE